MKEKRFTSEGSYIIFIFVHCLDTQVAEGARLESE